MSPDKEVRIAMVEFPFFCTLVVKDFKALLCVVDSREREGFLCLTNDLGPRRLYKGDEGNDMVRSWGELLTWVEAVEKLFMWSFTSSSESMLEFVLSGSR